jgi:hypothetical protein
LTAFTWGGCGKQTVAKQLHATYGEDDSFEWFGGNMDAKWLLGRLGRGRLRPTTISAGPAGCSSA